MKRAGRILVLDDEERWLDILTNLLSGVGFLVDGAGTVAEARTLLKDNFYHVAVFDVSMVSGDGTNTEGMQFLSQLDEEGQRGGMEVIMISAYADKQRLREAFKKYKVADFQDKFDFEQTEFLEQVRGILSDSVNLDLDVQWEVQSQREQVVLNLKLDDERVKRDTPLQARMAAELDDLLCRLFCEALSLLVSPLTPGTSGSGVLHATPFYKDGAARPVVVKFGHFRNIKREHENFKKHTQPFIGGRSTSVINLRLTTHLGGIVYSLLGSAGDKIESFSSYYAAADTAQIGETLKLLFYETCGAWYANPGHLQLRNLTEEYRQLLGFTDQDLGLALSQLKGVHGKRELYFDSLGGRAFTNPLLAASERQFMRPTYVCITHGDLNENNILVDDSGHTWLIDFESTGPGHILRDIAELDSAVRFQLLQADEATFAERLLMEETLCTATHFSDVGRLSDAFQTDNEALAKAYATSVQLRVIASEMMAKNPNDDLGEYYVAQFYYAMNSLRFLSWRGIQRQHALLSASLLADKLGL